MYLCYLDESGTTGASMGDTSHFVLAGLSIPIWHWRDADREVSRVLEGVRVGRHRAPHSVDAEEVP